jgi:hypothetical protein
MSVLTMMAQVLPVTALLQTCVLRCAAFSLPPQLAGDLFIMPSLGGGTTSEGGDTDAQGRLISKQGSRGTARTGSGRHQEEEVYGGLNMLQQDW